jgi:hypothetical protein
VRAVRRRPRRVLHREAGEREPPRAQAAGAPERGSGVEFGSGTEPIRLVSPEPVPIDLVEPGDGSPDVGVDVGPPVEHSVHDVVDSAPDESGADNQRGHLADRNLDGSVIDCSSTSIR